MGSRTEGRVVGIGKLLILAGTVLLVVGALLFFSARISFLGKLPGDIHVKRDNFEFYFPLATSIVVSLVLSGILWLITSLRKK